MAAERSAENPRSDRTEDCIFCRRVANVEEFRDLVVYDDPDYLVSHQIGDDGTKALGVLHFQTKRHVPSLGRLSARESAQLGQLLRSISHALESTTGAPWTYCFGFTEGPRHVHLVLGPRHAELPESYRRLRFAEWPDAPRGDRRQLAEFCATLRAELVPGPVPEPD